MAGLIKPSGRCALRARVLSWRNLNPQLSRNHSEKSRDGFIWKPQRTHCLRLPKLDECRAHLGLNCGVGVLALLIHLRIRSAAGTSLKLEFRSSRARRVGAASTGAWVFANGRSTWLSGDSSCFPVRRPSESEDSRVMESVLGTKGTCGFAQRR